MNTITQLAFPYMRSKSTNVVCLKDQDKEFVGKNEIAESMNQFFCSVGKDLANEIDDAPNPLFSEDYTINFQERDLSVVLFKIRSSEMQLGN